MGEDGPKQAVTIAVHVAIFLLDQKNVEPAVAFLMMGQLSELAGNHDARLATIPAHTCHSFLVVGCASWSNALSL